MGAQLVFFFVLLLLVSSSSSFAHAHHGRRRLRIPEAEEAELEDLIETESFVAVLYHDASKVVAKRMLVVLPFALAVLLESS